LRVKNRQELEVTISTLVSSMNYQDCIDKLKSAQIAFGDVNDVAGLSSHPHLQRRDIMTRYGPAKVPASPISPAVSSDLPVCPSLGQHSRSIMDEFS